MEVEVPHSAFAVRSGGEAAGFSVVFGWSWAVIVWKIYVFLDCPFPDSLTRILCCDFFCLCSLPLLLAGWLLQCSVWDI